MLNLYFSVWSCQWTLLLPSTKKATGSLNPKLGLFIPSTAIVRVAISLINLFKSISSYWYCLSFWRHEQTRLLAMQQSCVDFMQMSSDVRLQLPMGVHTVIPRLIQIDLKRFKRCQCEPPHLTDIHPSNKLKWLESWSKALSTVNTVWLPYLFLLEGAEHSYLHNVGGLWNYVFELYLWFNYMAWPSSSFSHL